MNERYRLVYILGAGHCGSTLLNLLLNGHTLVMGLSEIQRLKHFNNTADIALEDEEAGVFWYEVERYYESLYDQPFSDLDLYYPSYKELLRWSKQDILTWARPQQQLFNCITQLSGCPILVDASKSWQRLYLLQRSGLFDLQVIHLIRDGRAIVNAYYKKYGDFRGLRKWIVIGFMSIYLQRHFSPDNWYELRYERLAAQPKQTVRMLLEYLQLPYQPEMLQIRQHFYAGIGGNRMVRSQEQTIMLDERWKDEMSFANRARFALLGGWLNRYYGY